MAYSEYLRNLIKEARWALFICTNPICKNSVGDPNYEMPMGIKSEDAPDEIPCPSCGSSMAKVNRTTGQKQDVG